MLLGLRGPDVWARVSLEPLPQVPIVSCRMDMDHVGRLHGCPGSLEADSGSGKERPCSRQKPRGALSSSHWGWTGAFPGHLHLDFPFSFPQVQRLQDMEKVCLAVSQSSRGPYGPYARLPPHWPATRGHLAPVPLWSTLLLWAHPGRPPGPGREYEAFHLPCRLLPPQGLHLPWQCLVLACSFPHCHRIACLTAQMGR